MKSFLKSAVIVFAVAWSNTAYAGCTRLSETLTLAEHGFEGGGLPNAATLQTLNALIGELNNDAVLAALRTSGHANGFGDLRNFLTQLSLVSRNPSPETVTLGQFFYDDLREAVLIVRTACTLPDGTIRPDAPGENGGSAIGLGSRTPGPLRRLQGFSDAPQQNSVDNYNLRFLGHFFMSLILAVGLCIGAHFGIIFIRIINRGRSTCDIAASLECFGGTQAIRLTLLGRYGCLLELTDPTQTKGSVSLNENTYCRVNIDGKTLGGRVNRNASEKCSILFTQNLSHTELRQILGLSRVEVTYDLSILKTAHHRGIVFGLGYLPLK